MTDLGFTNEPIDVQSIPKLRDEDFVGVHPNYLKVSLIGYAIWTVIVLAAGIIVSVLLDEYTWIPLAVMGGVLALTALGIVATVLGVKNIGYQVRQHDLSYRQGVFIKTVETVPFVRVQHARVTQGPIQRMFGISSVDVNSAGPDLSLNGLGAEDAERLRAMVVERAGELVEES